MSKNSGIHHFENYIEMQKLNCILNICLNNDEVIPRAEKIKTLHTIETKWATRICCQTRIFKLPSHTEKIRKSMFKKYL